MPNNWSCLQLTSSRICLLGLPTLVTQEPLYRVFLLFRACICLRPFFRLCPESSSLLDFAHSDIQGFSASLLLSVLQQVPAPLTPWDLPLSCIPQTLTTRHEITKVLVACSLFESPYSLGCQLLEGTRLSSSSALCT